MTRLEEIARSDRLAGTMVIVTGCGYRDPNQGFRHKITAPANREREELWDTPEIYSGDYIKIRRSGEDTLVKLNIGSAVARVLALNGATVALVSKSADKLKHIRGNIDTLIGENHHTTCHAVDLLDETQVNKFAGLADMANKVYWVQSVGLGAGSYSLKNDNPYLPIERVPLELVEKEANVVLRSTHLMMQALLPKFRKQEETRVAIISSMSAIRGYSYGAAHCAAKGAIDRYANAAMLGLWKDNIFVTTIRPGAVDTGMYDSQVVQDAVKHIADDEYGCNWRKEGICLMPPTAVGEAVNFAFTAKAHVPSINMVAQGQFPNEGS